MTSVLSSAAQRPLRRCGAIPVGETTISWRVWAPLVESLELVLVEGNERQSHEMQREGRGYYTLTLDDIADGTRYALRLDGKDERPDPCSLWQPDGVHAPSAVYRPGKFRWTDRSWRGIERKDLILYELHVGTFTPEGTFDAIIPRLPELKDLGVTAVEIMPIAQFPGTRNWGYDGVGMYAAQNSYGGPEGFQRLVDACHRHGLAVILDVVYNHLGPEGNYLSQFAPYFTERYRTAWGPALNYDDAGSDPVRDFVLDNVRMWIEEFHVDGLRLDAVHAIFDMSARHILAAIKDVSASLGKSLGRATHIIGESDLNDPRYLNPPERGGYGLDAQWSDDFHHAVHAFLTREKHGYYRDYGDARMVAQVMMEPFVYNGIYSPFRDRRHGAPATGLSGDRFVVAIQNHDQVGNRAHGERLAKLVSLPEQRLAASLMLLSPYLPLIFMGEEYGETNPFLFFCSFSSEELHAAIREGRKAEFAAFEWEGEIPDPSSEETFQASKLQWRWPEGTPAAGMRRLYRDLLHARRKWPALRDYTERYCDYHLFHEKGGILCLIRGGRQHEHGRTIEVLFNLTAEEQPFPVRPEQEVILFASESHVYGGARTDMFDRERLLPYETIVLGPASWSAADEDNHVRDT